MIKEELNHNINLNQYFPTEAHKPLKNTILKPGKRTMGKYQMANNILDHAQIKQKRKRRKQL